MIDEEISKRAQQFAGFWSELLKNHPRYMLDYSWPSLATVQLILHPLVKKQQLAQTDENVLLDASAYITVMAYRCWTLFDSQLKVRAHLTKDTPPNIILSAEGGDLLPKSQKTVIKCTETLRQILKECPTPFPALPGNETSIEPSRYLVSLFGVGLFTGLSPYGDGPWKTMTPEEVGTQIGTAESLMAASTSEHYMKAFPGKALGSRPQLYSGGLILPPLGANEKFPGSRAAVRMQRFLKSHTDSETDILGLCLDLMQLPDRQLADVAFIVAAALQSGKPGDKLAALADAMGKRRLLYKGAIALARKDRGVPHSLEALIERNEIEKAENLVETDLALGLLPLFTVELKHTLTVPTLPHLLYWNMPQEARAAIDAHGRQKALPAELILLGISIDAYLGDHKRMNEELQNREKNRAIAETGDPQLVALRNELIATAAFTSRDTALAESYFAKAAAAEELPNRSRAELYMLRAECLLLLGKTPEAAESFHNSLKHFPLFQSELRLLQIESAGDDPEARQSHAERLSRIAPRSPEVFQFLIAEKAQTLTELV